MYYFTYTDDARSNKNQEKNMLYAEVFMLLLKCTKHLQVTNKVTPWRSPINWSGYHMQRQLYNLNTFNFNRIFEVLRNIIARHHSTQPQLKLTQSLCRYCLRRWS